MNENKNEKNYEELADESLDAVTGGAKRIVWPSESASPRVLTCGTCHRSDESVAVYTIDFGNGCTSMIYLCPNCLADERLTIKSQA